jgi:ABC-type uncharacterized transport system ATPase subunit
MYSSIHLEYVLHSIKRSVVPNNSTLILLACLCAQSVVYLGTEWANNPVIKSDIGVAHFLDSVGGYRHPERRDMLLNLLDVDLDW